MGHLYKLDFANGKSYIGITTKGAETRFVQHRKSSVKGSNLAVHHAWRKHGEPKLVVLAVVEDADLPATEIRAIKAFNTLVPNGYNVTEGGQTSPLLSPSVAAKVSAAMIGNKSSIGRKLSDEHKAKIGASSSGRMSMLGKRHSEETKKRIAAKQTGVPRPKTSGDRNPSKRQEVKDKISIALKGNKGRSGQTLSEEHKLRLSAALKKHHQLRKESSQ